MLKFKRQTGMVQKIKMVEDRMKRLVTPQEENENMKDWILKHVPRFFIGQGYTATEIGMVCGLTRQQVQPRIEELIKEKKVVVFPKKKKCSYTKKLCYHYGKRDEK